MRNNKNHDGIIISVLAFIPLRQKEEKNEIYTRYIKFLKSLSYDVLLGTTISKDVAQNFDLLLLPGGGDIYDNHYNDIYDLSAFNIFYNNNKKIIGICRGIQVINFALGGTLKNIDGHENTKHKLKSLKIKVNSYHHQAIDRLSKELTIVDKSNDGTIEIVKGNRILGFQFHPELEEEKDKKYWINFINKNLL